MKILVVSQYYYPEQFTITTIAEELKRLGHDITVLTGIPNYPMGKIIGDYKNKFYHEFINEVEIFRVPIILRGSGLKMVLNYLSYAFFASCQILRLKNDFDHIFVFEVSPVTQIFPAYFYKKFRNKKTTILVNCQDIWPEVLKSNDFKEESLVFKIGYHLSRYLYKKADKIIVSSRLFENYLKEDLGIRDINIEYLPNYADDWVLDVVQKKVDDKFHFLFAGNMGKAQNLNLILQAVSKCKQREKIIIDFVGDGTEMESLKDMTNQLCLQKTIIFHGRKKNNELKEYYDIADAYLLTLICDNKICYTIPSKLQGYMGSGKPIIASILGGAKTLIEESKCGIVCAYNDAEEFAQIIDDFVKNKKRYAQLGQNGREYFISYFKFQKFKEELIKKMEEM